MNHQCEGSMCGVCNDAIAALLKRAKTRDAQVQSVVAAICQNALGLIIKQTQADMVAIVAVKGGILEPAIVTVSGNSNGPEWSRRIQEGLDKLVKELLPTSSLVSMDSVEYTPQPPPPPGGPQG